MRWVAALLSVLLLVVQTVFAQAPTAMSEAIPLLRDAPRIALRNVRIVDGTGSPARPNQTVVIESGRIRVMGDVAKVTIPDATQTLDLDGRTLLPGFVMLHEHLKYNPPDDERGGFAQPQPFTAPRLYLSFGVTTIRTAGAGHPFVELNLKREIDSGRTPGPEIFLTGPYFNGPGSPFLDDLIVRNGDEARRAVRYWLAEGFTSMKAYNAIPKEAFAAMIDEAHARHATVLAHLGKTVSCHEAAELGLDSIEHGFGPCVNDTTDNLGRDPNGPQSRALIKLLIEKHVTLTVTPAAVAPILTDPQLELLHPTAREGYENEMKARPPAPPSASIIATQPPMVPQLVMAFARAGGRIVLGSDAGCCSYTHFAGLADHQALIRLVDFGFTPLEAIRIATSDGSRFLGIVGRTGSIAAGMEADLQVVRGAPDRDIRDIDNIEMVFANGIAYDPATLLRSVKGQVGWR